MHHRGFLRKLVVASSAAVAAVVAVAPAAVAAPVSSLPGSSLSGSSLPGPRCVVALDPGHNGEHTSEFDPVTGVRMIDYPNGQEDADVLEATRTVESRLNALGIGTVVLKESVDADVTYRERVDRASEAGAFLGVSVHSTPGAGGSAVFPQRQGGERHGTGADGEEHTVAFDNPAAAAESQRLSGVVAGVRSLAELREVTVRDNSFDHRGELWGGNLPVISLIADTPWIYNEFGSETGGGAHGLTSAEKRTYADGLTAGLVAAAATSPACTGMTGIGS